MIQNFDITPCIVSRDIRVYSTSSCYYIAYQFSYIKFWDQDNEGNINSKILTFILLFIFSNREFVHDCVNKIEFVPRFEREKKEKTNGCHRAFTHIEQRWVLSRKVLSIFKTIVRNPEWYYCIKISASSYPIFLEKCLPFVKPALPDRTRFPSAPTLSFARAPPCYGFYCEYFWIIIF